MILLDTGPIVAAINRGDPDHTACAAVLRANAGKLLTTGPVMTEAMHFLAKLGGWSTQALAWKLIEHEFVHLAEVDRARWLSMRRWMEKYRDLPMDLADASLVVFAESEGIRTVCTLDSDFTVYRIGSRMTFTLLP